MILTAVAETREKMVLSSFSFKPTPLLPGQILPMSHTLPFLFIALGFV